MDCFSRVEKMENIEEAQYLKSVKFLESRASEGLVAYFTDLFEVWNTATVKHHIAKNRL